MDYIEMEDVKSELGIRFDDTRRDDELAALVSPASRSVDNYCRRTFGLSSADVAREYDTAGAVLVIDDLQSLTALEARSGSTWAAMDVDSVDLLPRNAITDGHPHTMLRTRSRSPLPVAVRLTGTWGWADVPDEVRRATLIEAVKLASSTSVPLGVVGGDPTLGTLRVPGGLHSHARDLVAHLVRIPIG